MQDEHSIIGKILAKYPEITQEEKEVLDEWKAKNGNNAKFDLIVNEETRLTDLNRFLQWKQKKEESREKYHAAIEKQQSKSKVIWWNSWKTYVAAASVIAVLLVIGYKWYGERKMGSETEAPVIVQNNDVQPGQFKAKLTLDDGSVIILDSAANGKLVQQGGTHIINKDGQLLYKEESKVDKVFFNTLTTAKGETYGTVLSDGSHVWLNSQSSIRYPVPFDGDIRKVEIKGEAYFEIASSVAILANGKKGKRPFLVNASGLEVEVLGTHFNINSYGDEDVIKTTLLEGKVKVVPANVKGEKQALILEPGQQASLNKQTQELNKLDDIDVDEAVAWHYGYFQFNAANLQTVLRQLVRWYDVEVVYQGSIPKREFWGKISRSNSLSQVLHTLETNNVHFKLEGKKIVVSP